eukprot:gene10131-7090_t
MRGFERDNFYFVSGVVRSLSEDAIKNYFSQYGKCNFCLERDSNQRSLGYGWLVIDVPQEELEQKNPFIIQDKKLLVTQAQECPEGIKSRLLTVSVTNDTENKGISSAPLENNATTDYDGLAHLEESVTAMGEIPSLLSITVEGLVCVPISCCPSSFAMDPRVLFAFGDPRSGSLTLCPAPVNLFQRMSCYSTRHSPFKKKEEINQPVVAGATSTKNLFSLWHSLSGCERVVEKNNSLKKNNSLYPPKTTTTTTTTKTKKHREIIFRFFPCICRYSCVKYVEVMLNNLAKRIDAKYELLHDVKNRSLSYGTAGFRTTGKILPPVAARVIVIAALRGCWHRQKVKVGGDVVNMGIMITASHNPHEDNGFKIIDYNGGMLDSSWEHWCTQAVNSVSGEHFVKVVQQCCHTELRLEVDQLVYEGLHVIIGTDTRATGRTIADAATDILHHLNISSTLFEHVSTPQLHDIIVQRNTTGSRDVSPDAFEKKLLLNFDQMMRVCTGPKKHDEKKVHLVIDASNGVGALVLQRMLKLSETFHECGNVLHRYFDVTLLNADVTHPEGLNHECGADFVNRHRKPSRSMTDFGSRCASDAYADTHFYCLDGDADRIVALDYSDGQWTLMDGDRLSILYAVFLHELLGTKVISKLDVGIVQTAYANGASTAYVKDELHLKAFLAATGVKNIHPIAEARDIGVYFEANGHGTVLFNNNKIMQALAEEPIERDRVCTVVDVMQKLWSQVCGDAVGDLLMCEVAFKLLNMKFKDLRMLYTDRPAMQIKVDVPFPKRIKTTPEETRAVEPVGLQEELDRLVDEIRAELIGTEAPYARCFARPSGTEAIVRVYSETSTEATCKKLSDRACDTSPRIPTTTTKKYQRTNSRLKKVGFLSKPIDPPPKKKWRILCHIIPSRFLHIYIIFLLLILLLLTSSVYLFLFISFSFFLVAFLTLPNFSLYIASWSSNTLRLFSVPTRFTFIHFYTFFFYFNYPPFFNTFLVFIFNRILLLHFIPAVFRIKPALTSNLPLSYPVGPIHGEHKPERENSHKENPHPYCKIERKDARRPVHRRLFTMCLSRLLLILCVMAVCAVVHADATSKVVTTPTEPLANLQFSAQVSTSIIPIGSTLYVSSSSTCSNSLAGTCTTAVGLTCSFTVASSSLPSLSSIGVPQIVSTTLYFCSNKIQGDNIESFQLQTVYVTPRYSISRTLGTLTVNQATPVGTVIGLYNQADCSGLFGSTETVTSTPFSFQFDMDRPTNVFYLCATLPSTNTPIANSVFLLGRNDLTVTPSSVIRYRTAHFETYFDSLTQVGLSMSADCATLSQTAVADTGSLGKTYTFVVTVDHQEEGYTFCGLTSGAWIPATTPVMVNQYHVRPSIMYASTPTTMSFSLDSSKSTSYSAALFAYSENTPVGSECSGTPVQQWSTSTTWSVPEGVYFACLQTVGVADTLAFANIVTVYPMPTLTMKPSDSVVGLGVSATVTTKNLPANSVLTVAVAPPTAKNGQCDMSSASQTTETVASTINTALLIPSNTTTNALFTCISTPGYESDTANGYVYAVATIPVSKYVLSYNAAPLVGKSFVIGLDTAVSSQIQSGSMINFVLGSTCKSSSMDYSANIDSGTSNVMFTFMKAGTYLVCIKQSQYTDYNFGFNEVQTLTMYASPATMDPTGAVLGLPSTITVTEIPTGMNVFYTESSNCEGQKYGESTSQTSSAGLISATTVVDYSGSKDVLTLCVNYNTMKDGILTGPVVASNGELPVTAATIYPQVAVASFNNKMNVKVVDSQVLRSGAAFMVDVGQGCSSVPSVTLPIQVPDNEPTVMPYFIYTPAASAAGKTFTACVGLNGHYVDAGEVEVVASLNLTVVPNPAVRELPVSVTIEGSSFLAKVKPNVYVIAKKDANCAHLSEADVYEGLSGSVNPTTGAATSFVAPADIETLRMCVANSEDLTSSSDGYKLGYYHGGDINAVQFTSDSRYVEIGKTNTIYTTPAVLSGATLFLTPCLKSDVSQCVNTIATTTCKDATAKYFTSDSLVLTGTGLKPGVFFLCQSYNNAVAGAYNTLTALGPWSLSTEENPIRQFKSFDVTLTGWNIPSGGSFNLVVVAKTDAGCSSTTAATQSFQMTSAVTNIEITNIQPVQEVIFCVQPDSKYPGFEGMTKELYFYPTPGVLVADRNNKIVSPIRASASGGQVVTIIAKTVQGLLCSNPMSTTPGTINQEYTSTLYLNGCSSLSKDAEYGYYCESTDGMNYYNKGRLPIFRPADCSEGLASSISAVTYAPATKIDDLGIQASFVKMKFLSTSSDCSVDLGSAVITNGYSPTVSQDGKLYVCVYSTTDPTFVFTTATATVTISKWAVAPTCALSRFSTNLPEATTAMTITYKTPSKATTFSTSEQCGNSIANAAGFGNAPPSTVTYSTTAIRGIVYVCTTNSIDANSVIPVAKFLSVSTPTVTGAPPAIVVGATFEATLTVEGYAGQKALYSMQQGTDSGFEYASMYATTSRDVFLSLKQSCDAPLSGTSKVLVGDNSAISIDTSGINAGPYDVYLCTQTPAANPGVADTFKVYKGKIVPDQFETGMSHEIYIPLQPSTTFYLSFASDCSAASSTNLPTFTTDAKGYSTIVLLSSTGTPAPLGDYSVCYYPSGSSSFSSAGIIEVISSLHYSIRGYNYVIGIPAVMELLYDLDTSLLLPGFSTEKNCGNYPTTSYGYWTAISSKSIEVTATAAASPLYLCATVIQNSTRVGLPGSPSYITFSSPTVVPPNGGYDTCSQYTVNNCVAPGEQPPNGGVLAVIYGSCCNKADRGNLLGSSVMGSNNQCKLSLNANIVNLYPAGTEFTMCVWDSTDTDYCTTLGTVKVNSDCTASDTKTDSKKLSTGWLVFIIIACIIAGLLLAALIAYLIWLCCCRDKKEAEKKLVALRQMEGSDFAYGPDSLEEYMGAETNRNPLLYYAAAGQEELSATQSEEMSERQALKGTEVEEQRAAEEVAAAAAPRQALHDGEEDDELEVLHNAETIDRDATEDELSAEEEEDEEMEEPTNVAMVQRIEDDTRDQIALQEARERYMMCLAFKEQLERQRLKEKEEEVELGYEDDAPIKPFSSAVTRREYVPREDEDEDQDQDEEEADPFADEDHQLEYSEGEPSDHERTPYVKSRQEKSLAQSTVDGSPGGRSTSGYQPTDHHSHRASPSKSSSPFRKPHASIREEEGHDDTASSSPRRPDVHEVDPHMSNIPYPVPYADEEEAPVLADSSSYTPREATPRRSEEPPAESLTPYRPSNAPQRGSSRNSPARLEAEPAPAIHPMAFDIPAPEDLDDEDDEDAMSYTTTQRYHDENRFLFEEEESRRQRLCNWEEEERAQLAQLELGEYMKVARRPPSSDDDEESEATEDLYRAPHRSVDAPYRY